MAASQDYQWVKSTANELNNLLQVITESSQMLESLCEGTMETDRYFAMMRSAVERAANVTQHMIDRAGGASVPGTPNGSGPALHALEKFVTAPPKPEVRIFNPSGPLELIMLVDDEEFVTMLAERVLADEGYRVITTKDGMEAIDVYRRIGGEIDLILLDFTMPIMDGADVFDELLKMNPRVPVVLSSGFTEKDNLRGMLAKGLRGFIPKPYNQQKLLTEVRAALNAIKEEKTGIRPLL